MLNIFAADGLIFIGFYRAMHYVHLRGIATVRRPSVRVSVRL